MRQALVIGSGVAGLLTACVLADHYEQVTLIERDRVPAGAEALRGAGVPASGQGA